MWIFWLVVAIAFATGEMLNKGFFLIWFSVGALSTLFVSLIFSNILIQLLVFLAISIILLVFLTQYCSTHFARKDIFAANIDALIGQTGLVVKAIGENPTEVGQVNLDGEMWSALSSDCTAINKGEHVIVDEIRGVRLIVHKKFSSSYSSNLTSNT